MDMINKPGHYKGKFGLEAIEVVKNFIWDLTGIQGFYYGNTLKYLLRFQKKNGIEDLKKARKNLDWLIEEKEKEEIRNKLSELKDDLNQKLKSEVANTNKYDKLIESLKKEREHEQRTKNKD